MMVPPVTHSSILHSHPASPCSAVETLSVTTQILADGLHLRFELAATMSALRIPAAAQPGFANELWKHTCFEAFISADESPGYREFNFSPSAQWAAYAFTDCRQRDTRWQPAQALTISTQLTAHSLTLDATIPNVLIPDVASILHIGLTVVVETSDGTLSYWSLAHTSERPDFHQRAAFTLRLAPNTLQP
jgi:hypothetical protein